MKCYVLEEGKNDGAKQQEISKELEKEIVEFCQKWQARNLSQKGRDDDYTSTTEYEPLKEENFVVSGDKLVAYYADHFDVTMRVELPIKGEKVRLGDYDFSGYGTTWKIDRGHVAIVRRPDTDINPYYDEPRFHSQEEYDDYIKWRD